jgi:uncharacterized cupredoxin-like copper-binding protein
MIRLLGAAFALLAAAFLSGACSDGEAAPAEATVPIHFSHFETPELTVAVGEPITVTLRNDDPIEHEWIVGDEAAHERHRTGTEPVHDTRPTEVTVPAFSTRVTTVTFEEAGDYLYVCHLPGHEQYGMVGTLHVVEGEEDGG